MSMLSTIREKYLARFDDLIAEGEAYRNNISETTRYRVQEDWVRNQMKSSPYKTWSSDPQRFQRWKTSCLTLLGIVVPRIEVLQDKLLQFHKAGSDRNSVSICLGILQGFRDDFEHGLFDDLTLVVGAEISANYLAQADELLSEGGSSSNSHVPAAVLAGAVLERNLRELCSRQQPPIPTMNDKGEPKTLTPLIDELKKAGLFNELKAKQLRAWADIRNNAAHGQFDQFDRGDVQRMIAGITDFLAN